MDTALNGVPDGATNSKLAKEIGPTGVQETQASRRKRGKKDGASHTRVSATKSSSATPRSAALRGVGPAASRRNRRTSTSIEVDQTRNILNGALLAAVHRIPLNCFITINWAAMGVGDPVEASGRFLKLARDGLRSQGAESAHVWVNECGPVQGDHTHIVIHIPPRLRKWWVARQRQWLKRCGAVPVKGGIKSKPVGRSYRSSVGDERSRAHYMTNLHEVLDYMLKGVCPRARATFNVRRKAYAGVLTGKRTATSQNIGKTAWQRYINTPGHTTPTWPIHVRRPRKIR